MITVKFGPYRATIEDGVWKCEESAGIAHNLNQHFTLAHLHGYHADTDYSLAKMAAERLYGEMMDAEEPGFKHGEMY